MKRAALLLLIAVVAAIAFVSLSVNRMFFKEQVSWRSSIAAAPATAIAPRVPCANNNPLRTAFFGDLHIHTTLSWDGAGRGMMNTPDQAYRFATGEPLGLPPYDGEGRGLRTVQLDRPLDFAAVTDHAEAFGEVSLCMNPGSAGYDLDACRAFRGEVRYGLLPKKLSPMFALRANYRAVELCGEDGRACRDAALSVWQQTQAAAETWYDRSADCRFTTFHGYEYTYAPAANRVHRNVIFRNEAVPELPVSAVDEPEPEGLWRSLKTLCLETEGECDALAIPHNPNHSSGRMFPLSDPAVPIEERRESARLRAQLEPIVEMMQIKGESECRNGLWGVSGAPDEFCELEKYAAYDAEDCKGEPGFGKSLGRGCVDRTDYARYTIAAGMQEERELGVNPYRLGFIGSTDTHNAAAGDVEEWNFQGSTGLADARLEKRLKARIQRNPGGLVGIWAEENSRDSLYNAMQRREVFATSGPRMTMRLFAGWGDFSDEAGGGLSWCERPDALEAAYAEGLPMGSEISRSAQSESAPWFAVSAQRDAGTPERPGGLLQRLQMIKVTAREDGNFHQEVFDIAGGPNDAGVDTDSCETYGEGRQTLCTVWQDPGFDPAESAAYYVRVIENPSCRWTTWSCLALEESQRPALCSDISERKTTQERAWSSPIWYQGS